MSEGDQNYRALNDEEQASEEPKYNYPRTISSFQTEEP